MTVKRITGYGRTATDSYGLAHLMKERRCWKMGHLWSTDHIVGSALFDYELGQLVSKAPESMWVSVAHSDYIVYSYVTPIAWYDVDNGWVQPSFKYSRTTTRHQNRVATAISVMDRV